MMETKEKKVKKVKPDLDVEEFLLNLRANVITNEEGNQVDRVLYRV